MDGTEVQRKAAERTLIEIKTMDGTEGKAELLGISEGKM